MRYIEFMGEADLVMNKTGYRFVEFATKMMKSMRGLRAKFIK